MNKRLHLSLLTKLETFSHHLPQCSELRIEKCISVGLVRSVSWCVAMSLSCVMQWKTGGQRYKAACAGCKKRLVCGRSHLLVYANTLSFEVCAWKHSYVYVLQTMCMCVRVTLPFPLTHYYRISSTDMGEMGKRNASYQAFCKTLNYMERKIRHCCWEIHRISRNIYRVFLVVLNSLSNVSKSNVNYLSYTEGTIVLLFRNEVTFSRTSF